MISSGTTAAMVPALLQLDAAHAEVGLGTRPEVGGALRVVELEDDPLALTQRPEDRPVEGPGGPGVLRPVGVPDDGALARPRVVRLDDALHGSFLRVGAYDAAIRQRYAGGLAERRIRVSRAAPPGAPRAARRPGWRGRRRRRARRGAPVRHRRPHRRDPLRPAVVDPPRRRLESAGRQLV